MRCALTKYVALASNALRLRKGENGGLLAALVLQRLILPEGRHKADRFLHLHQCGKVLAEELHEALAPMKDMHKAWETFNPSGHLSFTASVRRKSADQDETTVRPACKVHVLDS